MSIKVLSFTYNREALPLCFLSHDNALERNLFQQSIQLCAVEYSAMKRQYNQNKNANMLSPDILLSNGMTLGEYAIHLVCQYNSKRKTKAPVPPPITKQKRPHDHHRHEAGTNTTTIPVSSSQDEPEQKKKRRCVSET